MSTLWSRKSTVGSVASSTVWTVRGLNPGRCRICFSHPKCPAVYSMDTMGSFSGVKRLKPAADRLLQRLRTNAAASPFPLCSCVTCKGRHFADGGLKQIFHIAVDWNRKLEALPYLCLSTLLNVKIYELDAEMEGCISRCSEIDIKKVSRDEKANLSEFLANFASRSCL
jgi:hypothetical protein